jgi:hypothetical protein
MIVFSLAQDKSEIFFGPKGKKYSSANLRKVQQDFYFFLNSQQCSVFHLSDSG